MMDANEIAQTPNQAGTKALTLWIERRIHPFIGLASSIPDTAIALLGRFSIAAIFWQSAQTKVEGFAIDLVHGTFNLGIPHIAPSAIELFREEYKLPLIPPEAAAYLAASAEHLFSVLILFGLATRFSALGLLFMTLTIQLFVYPDAYPTHGVWATVLLYLIVKGPGKISVDHWLRRLTRHNAICHCAAQQCQRH